ncbi:MAG: leucyl aminopeptidase [Wigglesworthia glossinidia]|nr:leucyl aminopeptidase [Wigglesworthia glossinidia]
MKFNIIKDNINLDNDTLFILEIFEKIHESKSFQYIETANKNYVSHIKKNKKISSRLGSCILVQNTEYMHNAILTVGCGRENNLDIEKYKKIIKSIINYIKFIRYSKIMLFVSSLNINNLSLYWKIRKSIEIIEAELYSLHDFKQHAKTSKIYLNEVIFYIPYQNEIKQAKLAIQHGQAITLGIKIAKDLNNTPPNICDPYYLSHQSYKLKEKNCKKISIEILNKNDMQNIGMHAYLSVSQGSKKPPYIAIIKYHGNDQKKEKPIILIGKGLTFDSGGISLKPSHRMDEMKYDMCGAGAVLGIMHAVLELNLNLNIIGILACCENMPDSLSCRPGDIVHTLSGKTVEIINTDAEGRLVLCDVISYVKKFNPKLIIDIATLTGACVVALGHHYTGLMSNCDNLCKKILHSAKITDDLVWRLPLHKKFLNQLKSRFADISNSNGNEGGAITAGCFLYEFAKKYKWAHLDIAGTAWIPGKNKSATGRPVKLLTQFLIDYLNEKNK